MNSDLTSAVTEFDSLKSAIQYQGRKASRAKSEYRRREILEAALTIVAREGIRGIKHRAVAKEANVPLASTTYYFKDIEELISDAFMLFAEKSLQVLDVFYGELNKLVHRYEVNEIHNNLEVREKFSADVVDMGLEYIRTAVLLRKDDLLAEMAFLLEALRDEKLRPLARDYRKVWYSRLIDFLSEARAPAPKEDAMLIISTVQGMLYEGVVSDGQIDEIKVRATLKRAIYILMKP